MAKSKYVCSYCGKEYVESNYYNSNSVFYANIGRIPYCKQCIEKFYLYYVDKYIEENCLYPEKKAIRRLCMAFDIYYREDIFDSSLRKVKDNNDINMSVIGQYMKTIQLYQYSSHKESFDTTIKKEDESEKGMVTAMSFNSSSDDYEADEKTKDFFGLGFSNEDYKFLKREYEDWTARHECNTKAQEEVFKRICFKQLEILKATRRGEDTKHLDATFRDLLDTAKLQPKQNKGEATAENQTMGTLIDKWETEKPLPEIDEELRDVDKIGLYMDVFFRGHLSKTMGLKNGLSNLYSKFMEKFTVEKPEYSDEENSEVLFDAIFGNQSSDNNDKEVVD